MPAGFFCVPKPYSAMPSNLKLVTRAHHPSDTIVEVGPVCVGSGEPVMIAGPCSVESREQIFVCAEHVSSAGAHVLRAAQPVDRRDEVLPRLALRTRDSA